MRNVIRILMLAMMAVAAIGVNAKDKKEGQTFNYELTREGCAVSRDSKYVIFTVYSYGKKKEITSDVGLRNAIHGIIFKGLPSTNKQGAEPPMIKDGSYETHKKYMEQFFSSGDYKQYIQETNKGFQDVIQTAGKEYKVGITVKVNVDQLKKRLEKDGVIKDYYDMMMQ